MKVATVAEGALGTLDHMAEAGGARLCVLSVHAHPDDEASKGAATVA